MTEAEFRDNIKKGLSGGYLFFGDEDYMKSYYAALAKKTLISDSSLYAFNYDFLKLSGGDSSAVLTAMATLPFMSDKKLVEVHVFFAGMKDKERDALINVLSQLGDYPECVLLLVIKAGQVDFGNISKKPSALYRSLTKYLVPVNFEYQTPAKLRRWVVRHFESEGVTVSDDACEMLVMRCIRSMSILAGETDKLVAYVKALQRNTVTAEDVKTVTPALIDEDAFFLANSVLDGDRTAALRALRMYKERGEHGLSVIPRIITEFNNMLTVAVYMKAGLGKAEIAKKTRLHEYRVSLYMRAVGRVETARLKAALDRCVETELVMKSSALTYTALERLICSIPASKRTPAR